METDRGTVGICALMTCGQTERESLEFWEKNSNHLQLGETSCHTGGERPNEDPSREICCSRANSYGGEKRDRTLNMQDFELLTCNSWKAYRKVGLNKSPDQSLLGAPGRTPTADFELDDQQRTCLRFLNFK
ncbi:hypothetical protein GUITHDRAFT_149930 [Guillardia theta CCMP2712]|uniref:Uncharacterized protein n=1 Tax=Guillardia theta (strain CCMP2712) TaxID=905079 RepID=L1K340_GUITC|nr:hypothetical protein GUITHDRAFT_149930 [Guillardia theta CCMP2712]EKX55007.1 hypothetical protein GUITHDRAFT_149930 [Guillardia theta CCMP2712]|eukprot:XP_005841987.1 hypothetical protein GUITHDRAFT_149930 [Guillardia theta CCMP2712]